VEWGLAVGGWAIPVSVAAIVQNLFTIGLLTVVGVILFIVGAAGENKYPKAPHIIHAIHSESFCTRGIKKEQHISSPQETGDSTPYGARKLRTKTKL